MLMRHASCAELSFPCLEYVIVNNYYQCYLIVQEKNFNFLKDVLCKKGHVFHAWSIYKHRMLLQRLLHKKKKNKLSKPLCYVSMKTIDQMCLFCRAFFPFLCLEHVNINYQWQFNYEIQNTVQENYF